MSVEIHPTSIVSPKAKLGVNVKIGPFCVIEEDVEIGDNTELESHVSVKRYTTIGSDCKIHEGSVIGGIPQHLGFKGEETYVRIGNNVTIREYVTIHRGTSFDDGITKIDDNSYLMAYVHIAHDCKVGHDTILANAVTLAGHVKIGNYVFIGGLTPIHQFCRVGDYAMVGGASAVDKDIPPYTRAAKNHVLLYGLNLVGLRRRGFSSEQIKILKEAYRILFRKSATIQEGIKEVEEKLPSTPEIQNLIEFVKTSKRGIAPEASKRG
ncbi:MAG TPA: acyl-ACP--UDP-N-acetylglucosamine O-acyltransferase [Persephonella sp.]|uniref:Acyl-[acyl-carrier-protein]--UDP-N-acetylglucosamine O-acyltransferase n=1 Tax=Persephonella marina (strain DSM 14350 / EX-H1) TaxID=123214 RepID=C0QTY2_PERMH|nr:MULTISPECIES: acyl-ACP--UDP-N-acetylglucosamine O-acyltransferase [Persephonella]ACO04478.1 acyl-(acyl-carrier-protein)-UDP-N-acetylglucosamine O-acyltransferase [Persephonella marina EX-H1]HCB70236.1 acyl-ACP--UDP-N-acetylglucosamine O-acyltransferase [Persephonella sp.]